MKILRSCAAKVSDTRDLISQSDAILIWLDSQEVSREQMALMLSAGSVPIYVAESESSVGDQASSLAKYSPLVNCLGQTRSEDEAIFLIEKCTEHLCSSRIDLCYSAVLADIIRKSGSPIETRLALHMANAMDLFCIIRSQVTIPVDGKNYRADFVVSSEESDLRMVIEADGHNFHERTKEQAAKDRSRDRAMLAEGYRVMRFTGSEIWAKPQACAAEVRSFWENNS